MSSPQVIRSCAGCRHTAPITELARFVLDDGQLRADPMRRLPGRGAWVHRAETCWQAATRRGGFARSFRQSVTVSAGMARGW